MYECDKCGEKISDINKPCPSCGLTINVSNNVNKHHFQDKAINVIIMIIVIAGGAISLLFLLNLNNRVKGNVNFSLDNYSITYDGDEWIESELSNDEYYILQNADDLNSYLQFPIEAEELRMNFSNSQERSMLFATLKKAMTESTDLKFYNTSADFQLLEDTNYYYMTTEFYKISDNNFKGKRFWIISSEGKFVNVYLQKGTKSISSLDNSIYKILKSIEM